MESFKVRWTEGGRRHVSVVSYDKSSARDRMVRLLADGAQDVETIPVKPGEDIEVEQPRTGRVVQRRHTVRK